MEKKTLIQVVANVRIESNILADDKDFVKFVIQSTDGGVEVGRNLLIVDYRSVTLQATKAINFEDSWEDRYKAESSLIKAVQQPAKVVVMEEKDGDKKFYCINFYPANGQKPEALFSKTSYYIGKYSLEFSIEKDESFWSWWIWIEENSDGDYQAGYGIEKDGSIWGWQNEIEESFPQKPKTSRCWNRELVLLALTDNTHRVVVKRHEPIKLGHSKKNLIVIGTDILYR